jgi:tetratricopeptide (TPR) repeat protein
MMTTDPYRPYLRQADELFARGETVKAGQIWQAILKQHPSHMEAREGLMAVKERLLALREAESLAAAARPVPPMASEPATAPEPETPVPSVVEASPAVPGAPLPVTPLAAAAAPPEVPVPVPPAPAPEPIEEPAPEPLVPPIVDPPLPIPEATLPVDSAAVASGPLASPSPMAEPTETPAEIQVPPLIDPRSTAPEGPLAIDPAEVITGAITFPEHLVTEASESEAQVPPVVDPSATAPEAPLAVDPAEVITGSISFPEHLVTGTAGPESQASPVADPTATAPEAPLAVDPAEVITGSISFPEHLIAAASGPESNASTVADPSVTAPEGPLAIDPAAVATGALNFNPERLLAEGCTLYDMGQTGDALQKWEQVLALDPDHSLVRGYINGARQELGLPLLQVRTAPVPVRVELPPAEEDIDKLLREAVQLYDMGLTEEAILKWERVLVLEPQRNEIEGYLRQARTELESAASASSQTPAATQATGPELEALELKLRQAEHLLTLQRHEEAAFTFQQALAIDPSNASALQGLERCRRGGGRPAAAPESRQVQAPALHLDAQGRISMADVEDFPVPPESQGIEPPAALLKATPPPRAGLSLPDRIREATERWPWLKNSRIIAIAGGCLLVVIIGFAVVHSYRRDQDLKDQVRTDKAAALASVAQQAQAPDLTETAEAIRQEAEVSLAMDPLRAYFRAETLLSLAPGDPAGTQLLEKARLGLAGGVTGASLPEFQKHLQNGDLEAAHKVIDALLRAQPGNAEFRARAGRLQLTLCFNHAGQAKWDEAREDLLWGRALFPGDKTWQARLKLLEHVKSLPKSEQPSWIALLS